MTTLDELTAKSGLDVLDHLAGDAQIPILDGIQAQGDLLIIPLTVVADEVVVRRGAAWTAVPSSGVEVLRGAAMGNPHSLVADPGAARWTTDVDDAAGLALGVVEVTGPAAWLLHREHGGMGLAAGCWVIRRQREQADELRLVAD